MTTRMPSTNGAYKLIATQIFCKLIKMAEGNHGMSLLNTCNLEVCSRIAHMDIPCVDDAHLKALLALEGMRPPPPGWTQITPLSARQARM